MRLVGFIGPSYQLKSVNVDCQRCINLYPELDELGTGKEREVAALVSTPGLALLATVGSGPIRGSKTASNGTLYVVSGNTLYSVSSAWVGTSLGTLGTSTGRVSMDDNGIDLLIVDGTTTGYHFTFATSTFAQITDVAFLGADIAAYQDGYFVLNRPNTNQFYISGLMNITFNGLDITSPNQIPDNIIGHISNHRDLWIFNAKTTEVYFDSGASGFPFEPVQGAFIQVGCAAKFSIAKMSNTVFWLGQDEHGSGMVYMAAGYEPQRISTHAIEDAIQSYSTISDAEAYCYQENGHYFYVLSFPTANASWAFDMTTRFWHERAYNNQGKLQRHRAATHSFAYGVHVTGDYETGNLYRMSTDIHNDNGISIIRRRVTPHMTNGLDRIFYHSFQLDMETGVGLDGLGQGTNPQAILEFSDDGGHRWSNEKWANVGKIGQTRRRAKWDRLGSSRDRVFRISISDPVRVTLIGAELKVSGEVISG